MKLHFLGATQTVTGSKYVVEYNRKRIMIDCGLFQGLKELRLRNWAPFPVDPKTIDAIILTHAHIDHSGYIPLLIKQGFRGKIYCSSATYDLCTILLPDSGHIHEEDARRANEYGYSKHHPALPLYTVEEAKTSLKQFKPVAFGTPIYLDDAIHFTLSRSGHILGSSFISLTLDKKTIVFSGDLGRFNDPIMNDPATLHQADYILIESTYGDRLHDKTDPAAQMQAVIEKTIRQSGTIVIPSFAVGRAQILLYHLAQLKKSGKLPHVPIFLDSPMAISVTDLFCRYTNEHKLSKRDCADIFSLATYTRSVEESKSIEKQMVPSIIISASGMATGGRVLHHLKHYMVDPKNTILLSGYQAVGTRGDRIFRKEDAIKIHGQMYPLRASVESITGLSAHGDYEDILTWLSKFKQAPKKIFITHGEEHAAASLKIKIEEQLQWQVTIPHYLDKEVL